MNELKTTDSTKVVEHLEKGAKFDVLKIARGLLPQLGSPAHAGDVHDHASSRRRRSRTSGISSRCRAPVPAANQSLEVIAPTREENTCTMPA